MKAHSHFILVYQLVERRIFSLKQVVCSARGKERRESAAIGGCLFVIKREMRGGAGGPGGYGRQAHLSRRSLPQRTSLSNGRPVCARTEEQARRKYLCRAQPSR